MTRRENKDEPGVLVGVRAITRYAPMGPQTFYKLHREHGFPAMRMPDGRWCTTKVLIDEWVRVQCKAQREAKGKVKQTEEQG